MEAHKLDSRNKARKRVLIHAIVILTYTIMLFIAAVYFFMTVLSFLLIVLVSFAIYVYGLHGIRKIIKRFELTMPNKRTINLHILNMLFFVIVCSFDSYSRS